MPFCKAIAYTTVSIRTFPCLAYNCNRSGERAGGGLETDVSVINRSFHDHDRPTYLILPI